MVPKLCGNSSVSCSVILLEIAQNGCWCRVYTVGFASRVFRDTDSYSRVKLGTDLPKRPVVKVKMADPWLTVCDCSHYLRARQKYITGTGSGILYCLLQFMALPYSRQHMEVIHSNLLCVSCICAFSVTISFSRSC